MNDGDSMYYPYKAKREVSDNIEYIKDEYELTTKQVLSMLIDIFHEIVEYQVD